MYNLNVQRQLTYLLAKLVIAILNNLFCLLKKFHFYTNVNLLIQERGKWITKLLCEKLALTDLDFYVNNRLDQMKKISFFNDLIKK